jgi:hypothetical protein
VIPLGRAHLRKIVAVEHYHRERNHQGCGNQLIQPPRSGRHTSAPSSAGSGSAGRSGTTIEKPHDFLAIGLWHPGARGIVQRQP